MKKYLVNDIVGQASGIVYGKKHDKVTVIKAESEMILVELNGERFHMRMEYLTDTVPVEIEQDPVIPKQQTKIEAKQYLKPAARKKVAKAPDNQTQLF